MTKRNGGRCGSTSSGRGSAIIAVAAPAAFLAGTFLALAAFLAGDADFLAAFFAGDADFLAAFFAVVAFAGTAAAFLAGTFLAGAALAGAALVGAAAFFFAGRVDPGAGDGRASSATRRGGSSPARTNGRTSPFLSTWRALVGGGVPMAVSGM